MADLKISALDALDGGDLVAADELAIVDDSASETKKITVSDLIENGVTLISDDAIPGAKILFAAGDIATADLADLAVNSGKLADDAVTAAKIADNVIVDLVSTLPASGDYTGQLALDTDDNSLYVWDGSAWQSTKAPSSVNAFTDTSDGIINITTAVSSGTATVTASIDDTTSAAQFLAGPVASSGAVGYRVIDGGDLPTPTTTAKGGVIVNGEGLRMDSDTIEVDNDVTASSTHHVVTYNAKGLITGGRTLQASDLPIATSSAVGGVSVGAGLTVNAAGDLSVDNTVTSGSYAKVTVTSKGLVSAGSALDADDIPNHSAAKITSGTISGDRIAGDAITGAKLADQSTTKFGGAAGSDNVTIFPDGDYKGQFFFDETTQDLYLYSGSAFVPVTVLSGNLVNAGAYNASTNEMSSVTSAGSSAGFSVGNALPAPAKTNLNHYVVVDTSGTGTGAAPAVALAPPDMLLSQGVGTEYSLIDVSNAIAGQTASNISLIATGDVVATDVQAAITELDQEKVPKAGGTMTGNLALNNADIVFEGSTADDYETTLTVTDPTADRTITLPNTTGTVVTTGDSGTVTSAMIANSTIVNADISGSAEIAVSKLANGTSRQLLQTNADGTSCNFTSNVDVPGTLDVTNAGTFDSTVSVAGLLSANGLFKFTAGSETAPGIYPGTDTNTGIYSPGNNKLSITTNGSQRFTVDADGKIGIGTGTPGVKVVIAANNNNSGEANTLRFTDTDTTTTSGQQIGKIDFYSSDSQENTSVASIQAIAASSLGGAHILFRTKTTSGTFSERVRITDEGYLGIGASSPTQLIDLESGSGGRIAFTDTGTRRYSIGNAGTGSSSLTIRDESDSADRITITNGGNVGIGNDSPNNILSLAASEPRIEVEDTDTNARFLIDCNSSAGSVNFRVDQDGSAANSAAIFTIDNAEKMRVTHNDRLLLGTSASRSVGAPVGAFEVEGEDGNEASLSISRFNDGSGGAYITLGKARGTKAAPAAVQLNDNTGFIEFAAYDGGDLRSVCAGIHAYVDGTPGTNDVPGRLSFRTTTDGSNAPTERIRIGSNGDIKMAMGNFGNTGLIGQNLSNGDGVYIDEDGGVKLQVSRWNGTPFGVNRMSNDGDLIAFFAQGTNEGSITVSGTTVSLTGGHLSRWSQLESNAERTEILRGSVLSNLDEMCEWGEEDNEQLNRMKVSDVEGDPNVAGVFQGWDDEDETYLNDFHCAMTGDFIIRIAQGTTVARGDLLMSAGDGTAKPQGDDIVRSKTIAKVTSTTVSTTYADGSYCVPCVLMAC